MREAAMQELSDCGLNPFAVQLLMESWRAHPHPRPVAFLFGGIPFAVGYNPHDADEEIKLLRAALEPFARLMRRLEREADIAHSMNHVYPLEDDTPQEVPVGDIRRAAEAYERRKEPDHA